MKYMLDTNICSYIIKNRPIQVLHKFKKIDVHSCVISAVTLAELKYWVARNKKIHQRSKNSGDPKVNERVINDFVSHLIVMDFDDLAADVYGKIRAELEANGTLVGNADLMIGAHAISLKATLVTNNIKEFKRLPGIELENWLHK